MQNKQTTRGVLPETPAWNGPARAVRESEAREELRVAWFAVANSFNRSKLGSRRRRFDRSAPGTADACPFADVFSDLMAALVAGAPSTPVCVAAELFAQLVRDACTARDPRPTIDAADLAETREQGEADTAVRAYLVEPKDSPNRVALLDAAIRELSEHRQSIRTLEDRLREERMCARRPRLVP